jgi:hypothetical protein
MSGVAMTPGGRSISGPFRLGTGGGSLLTTPAIFGGGIAKITADLSARGQRLGTETIRNATPNQSTNSAVKLRPVPEGA